MAQKIQCAGQEDERGKGVEHLVEEVGEGGVEAVPEQDGKVGEAGEDDDRR